jgi:hypothetical protein
VTAIPAQADPPQAASAAGIGRLRSRLLRAHPSDPVWARPALAALLLATALLYLVGLNSNGWATSSMPPRRTSGPPARSERA